MAGDGDRQNDASVGAGTERDVKADLGTAYVWAAMSHEIRTPLSGVLGMLEILSSTSLTDEQRRIIATAEESSAALMRIINDVLDLARLESTTVEFELKSIDLAELVEDCAEFLASQADAKGLVLTCETDSQIPELKCDPLRVRQVLLNLASNAIKFTDTGGVAVSVDLVQISDARATVRFVVEDSGVGIPDGLKTFLFQPFSQIKNVSARGEGGVGLGLAICRNLVEAMGGVIRAENIAGRGARFSVEVPFDISAGEGSQASRSPGAGEAVAVIVNSDEPAIKIAMRYMREAGITLHLAASLNDLNGTEHSLSQAVPPVVVIGPDAEQEEVVAVSEALQKVNPRRQALIVWLYPHAIGNTRSLEERGVRTVRAYPLRRALLMDAVLGIRGFGRGAVEAPLVMHHARGAGLGTEAPEEARAEGRIVLIAEDNPVNQQVLRQQLAILGFPCDVAGTGIAALQMMEERRYVLLLCDCHMPGMDGFELTRRVREREQKTGDHLPIIAVTANVLPGESFRCKAAGMDDYLAKPIEIKVLQSAMEHWLDVSLAAQAPSEVGVMQQAELADHSVDDGTTLAQIKAELPNASHSVDLKALQSLYGDDTTRLSNILAQWTLVIEEAARELSDALSQTDRQFALEAVHRLKGSAGIAGAHQLSEAASALEAALRTNDTQQINIEGPRVQSLALQALDEAAAWNRKFMRGPKSQAAL